MKRHSGIFHAHLPDLPSCPGESTFASSDACRRFKKRKYALIEILGFLIGGMAEVLIYMQLTSMYPLMQFIGCPDARSFILRAADDQRQ